MVTTLLSLRNAILTQSTDAALILVLLSNLLLSKEAWTIQLGEIRNNSVNLLEKAALKAAISTSLITLYIEEVCLLNLLTNSRTESAKLRGIGKSGN
jgi:hypothetical protein